MADVLCQHLKKYSWYSLPRGNLFSFCHRLSLPPRSLSLIPLSLSFRILRDRSRFSSYNEKSLGCAYLIPPRPCTRVADVVRVRSASDPLLKVFVNAPADSVAQPFGYAALGPSLKATATRLFHESHSHILRPRNLQPRQPLTISAFTSHLAHVRVL